MAARSQSRSKGVHVKEQLPRWPEDDPVHARERERYTHPLPSRLFLSRWFEALGRPVSFETLTEAFHLETPTLQQGLERRLKAMRQDGELVQNRREQWCLVRILPIVTGLIRAERDGFGYLEPSQGGARILIPPAEMTTLMDGDRVMARIGEGPQGVPIGRIIEIIERAHAIATGRFFEQSGVGFVTPYHPRLFTDFVVSRESTKTAQPGDFVTVEIVEYPKRGISAIVRILDVMGASPTPALGVELALTSFALPVAWPEDVLLEIGGLEAPVPPYGAERRDLREIPLVTIDGEDARDFDDAVFAEKTKRGFRLIVAIADVSAYVRPGTALDREAQRRGTSAYFPDRVVPMLPERLSNDLCSLRPGEDRLAYVADLELDRQGQVRHQAFYPAVIHSHARLVYEEVAEALELRKPEARRRLGLLIEPLEALYALYRILRDAREKRGAIDFETREPRIVFGAEGQLEAIRIRERTDAHRLIEECMILANSEVARWLEHHRIATLYRVHPPPQADRISDLRLVLGNWGVTLPGGSEPKPADFAHLIRHLSDHPERRVVEMLLLRSLSRASYEPEPTGHFGLALRHYCHFTSPIRRYPDLIVHRGLAGRTGPDESQVPGAALAVHCSYTERRADEASRTALEWCQLGFLSERIGEVFDGIVTGVTGFGLFVELDTVLVSGLIHISNLPDDYYHHDPKQVALIGEHSGWTFKLGDRIAVKVMKVDLEEGKLDLGLVPPRRRH